jgi:hypothetical protein
MQPPDRFELEMQMQAPMSGYGVTQKRKRREPVPRGYAALPGTGPAGETCRSCKHYTRREMAKTYLKCGLMTAYWTGGGGSDIRAKSPACRHWEPQTPTSA